MKKYLKQWHQYTHHPSTGLLLIRLSAGLIFFTHGLMKVESLPMTILMFIHFGFPVWVAYFIAWLEVIGGLGLMLGIGTRIFGFLFGVEMLVATILIGFARGFGFEFTLCLVSFGIMFLGAGRFALHTLWIKE
jgi:uncharacterized membrane protein YphA (DoxX/SURF4 family)